jgi:hypothetical protein
LVIQGRCGCILHIFEHVLIVINWVVDEIARNSI